MNAVRALRTKSKQSLYLIAFCLLSHAAASQEKAERHRPKVSAHRGASNVAPENTLASYRKAIELKADFIEVDVRTTQDGHPVCLHDASLKRTTGLDLRVDQASLSRVKEQSAGRFFSARYQSEKVPTFEEVCQLVSRTNRAGSHYVRLYVDCKDIRTKEIVRILQRYQLLDSAVFYGDTTTLREVRSHAANARLLPAYDRAAREAISHELRPYAFDVSWDLLDPAVVSWCHRKGIGVFCDILNKEDRMSNYRRAIQLGVDVIQTDKVKTVKNLIDSR